MKRTGIVFYLLVIASVAAGQTDIDWSVAVQGLSLNITDMVEHPDGGIVAIGIKEETSYSRTSPACKHNNGTSYNSRSFLANQTSYFVIRLDEKGQILYSTNIYDDEIEFHGIAISESKKVVILAYISYYNDSYQRRIISDLFSGQKEVNDGLYLFTLNDAGGFVSQCHLSEIDDDADLDINGFQSCPTGNFLVNGHCHTSKILKQDDSPKFSGGGDYVMMIDTLGKVIWSDVVAYRAKTCCTYSGEGNNVSVSNNGTIYMGGTYFGGGIFSTGLQTLSPVNLMEENKRTEETYVVSYTSKGKINWVQTSLNSARFQRIAASEKGVFIGLRTNYAEVFGEPIKGNEGWNTVLGFISKKGKLKWLNVENVQRFDQMTINTDGHLVVCGEAKRKYPDTKASSIAGMTLNDNDDAFFATISNKGKGLSLKSLTLWTSSERMQLVTTTKGEFYFGAEIWCGLPIALEKINKKFPKLSCSAGTQIIGKFEP